MTKNEFLDKLKNSIQSLGEPVVSNKINYYNKYIDEEVSKGKNIDLVLNELGEPNLIGKTIVDVEQKKTNINNETYNNSYSDSYGEENKNDKNFKNIFSLNTNATLGCIISFLVLFVIISYILRFLGYALIGTFAFTGGPIGFILIMLLFYYMFFRKR